MAIAEITEYAHLSDTDIEALAAELCAIRQTRRGPRGAKDKTYSQRTRPRCPAGHRRQPRRTGWALGWPG